MSGDQPTPAAPADIAVVRDFVNTTDHETRTDDLATRADLTGWLHRAGLLPVRTRATEADLAVAHELRRGLRRALELNHDGTSEDIPALDTTLVLLPVTLHWTGDASRLVPTKDGVQAALTRVVIAMHQAVAAGTWWRLKVCASDECEWAYYDASKNRSRMWCEYGCGNRRKVRAYRARQRAAGAPGQPGTPHGR